MLVFLDAQVIIFSIVSASGYESNSTYEIWFAYNFYRRMQKDMSDICWYGIKPVIDLDLYYISTE